MERYDYADQVKTDVLDYLKENADEIREMGLREPELLEYLYDTLFVYDNVTGNGSGSYFCNAWRAEEAICHNLDLVSEAYSEFGGFPSDFSAESADVTIRCYLLSSAIVEALEDAECPENLYVD